MTYQPAQAAPDRGSVQTNAIILIVVGLMCGGMIPSIFGIIALAQMDTDIDSARRMNRYGWISAAILAGLAILAILLYIVVFVLIMGAAFLPFIFGA